MTWTPQLLRARHIASGSLLFLPSVRQGHNSHISSNNGLPTPEGMASTRFPSTCLQIFFQVFPYLFIVIEKYIRVQCWQCMEAPPGKFLLPSRGRPFFPPMAQVRSTSPRAVCEAHKSPQGFSPIRFPFRSINPFVIETAASSKISSAFSLSPVRTKTKRLSLLPFHPGNGNKTSHSPVSA